MRDRRCKQGVRWAWVAMALCIAVWPLGGCVSAFAQHRQQLETIYSAGQFEQAAATLDDPMTRDLYGAKNEVLWQLDRGAVALALKDHDQTIDLLNRAEAAIEVQQKTAGDVIAQWTLNDTAARYIAEPYEDMYLNVIKILAQLEAGRIQGGATVEARRMASKADRLRDLYLKYEDAAKSKMPGAGPPPSNVVAVNKAGDFLESPLGTYLTAVTFMKSGEREFQRVAGRRLVDSIELQKGLIGPVNADDFRDLEERDPDSVNVLFVALSGRGPTKYAQRIGPIPLGTVPVYFELPYLKTYPSEVTAVRVEVEGLELPPEATRLRLVEDLSAVATENHRRTLPAIYARTLIRYAIKAGISTALTEMGRRQAHDNDQALVQIAGVVAGLAVLAATEQADLRAWVFLPGEARVGLLKLPPGPHRVRVVYEGPSGGAVFATPWQDISVSESGLSSVVTHYWR